MRINNFLIFLFHLFYLTYASTNYYTLHDLKKIALEQNVDHIIKENESLISKNNYLDAVKVYYYPDIAISATSPYYSALRSYDSTVTNYIITETSYVIGKLIIEQKLPWDTLLQFEIQNKCGYQPEQTNNISGKITLKQPILKQNNIKNNRENTKKEYELALLQVTYNEKKLINEVENAFYNLYSSELNLYLSELEQQSALLNFEETEKKYKSGLITEIFYLRISLNYKKKLSSYNSLMQQKRQNKQNLATLLNIENSDAFEINTNFIFPNMKNIYDYEASLKKTLTNDLILIRLHNNRRSEKISFEQKLQDYNFNGDLALSVEKKYNNDIAGEVRVDLKSPIYKRGSRKRFIENHNIKVNSLELEITNRIRNIKSDLLQRINSVSDLADSIILAKENMQISKKTFEIDSERFKLGLITAETLINTEEEYFGTEIDLIIEKIKYLKEISYLENNFWMVKKQ